MMNEHYNVRMVATWRLLITGAARGAWNMAVDEAILEHVGRGTTLPTLRLYAWEPACLSLGYAQPYGDVDVIRLNEHGWEVVRRPTGGRAILHTDELTYSVVAPLGEPTVTGTVLESYGRLAGALLEAVRSLGLGAEMKGTVPRDPVPGNPVCFEIPSSYEITAQGKKLIGSAQARRREGVLQHGSLPLTGDLARIAEVLVFEGEAARREAGRRLLTRATTVESVLGRSVSWEETAEAFSQAFESKLGLCLERHSLSASEQRQAEDLIREKYDHPQWTQRV
jgi:lipoate-protein ligase A